MEPKSIESLRSQVLLGRYNVFIKGILSKRQKIISIFSESIVVTATEDQKFKDEIFGFSDVVKIIPNFCKVLQQEKKTEFEIEVLKKGVRAVYHTSVTSFKHLMCTYLQAIDNYMLKVFQNPVDQVNNDLGYLYTNNHDPAQKKNRLLEDYQRSSQSVELDMCLEESAEGPVYRINFSIQRGGISLTLLNSGDSIQAKSYQLLQSGLRRTNQLEYKFIHIKELMISHSGFRLMLDPSEAILTFFTPEISVRNQMIKLMKDNSRNYIDFDINMVVPETSMSVVGHEMSLQSKNSFMYNYQAFSLTAFGDIKMVDLRMNDSFIYETLLSKPVIVGKYPILSIVEIVVPVMGTQSTELIFDSNQKLVLHFPEGTLQSFLVDLFLVLENLKKKTRNSDGETLMLRNRLKLFSMISPEQSNLNEIIRGYTDKHESLKVEQILLKNLQDPNIPKSDLSQSIEKVLLNSDMDTESEFESLLKALCGVVIELGQLTCHRLMKSLAKLVYDSSIKQTNSLFKLVQSQDMLEDGQEDSQIFKNCNLEKESIKRQLDKDIDHLSSHATQYDNFLYPADLKKTITFGIKIISFLMVCTQNKFFFKYFAVKVNTGTNEESKFIRQFFKTLHTIAMQDSFPILGMTVTNLLHKLIRNVSQAADLRAESLNKNLVLSHKCEINFGNDVTEFLARKILAVERQKLHSTIVQHSFQIHFLLSMIEAFISDRKQTTNPEDFFGLLKWLKSDMFFVILKDLNRTKCQSIVFKAGNIINSIIQSFETKESIKAYQSKMLNHSTLILDNIKLLSSPISAQQFALSTTIVYHIVITNIAACALVSSILPKNIFRLIDATANDISKWTLSQWQTFFIALVKDYDSSTEQWNEINRKELINNLDRIGREIELIWGQTSAQKQIGKETGGSKKIQGRRRSSAFREISISSKAKTKQGKQDGNPGLVINMSLEVLDNNFITEYLKALEAGIEKRYSIDVLRIRWNHEEYKIKYQSLADKLPVSRYYLTKLFQEDKSDTLSCVIKNPKNFWEELIINFISSTEYKKKRMILSTMILLYRQYHDKIKELTVISYLLKLLEDQRERQYHYLILQLLFTGLTVNNQFLMSENQRIFQEISGISVIREHICLSLFAENIDRDGELDIKPIEEHSQLQNFITKTQYFWKDLTPVQNFTSLILPELKDINYHEPSLRIILCLQIMKLALSGDIFKSDYEASNLVYSKEDDFGHRDDDSDSENTINLHRHESSSGTTISQSEAEAKHPKKISSKQFVLYPAPQSLLIIFEEQTLKILNSLILLKSSHVRIAAQELISTIIGKFEIGGELDSYYDKSLLALKYLTQDGKPEQVLKEGKTVAKNFRECFFSSLITANDSEYAALRKFANHGFLEGELEPKSNQDPDQELEVLGGGKDLQNQRKKLVQLQLEKVLKHKKQENITFGNIVKLYPLFNLLPPSLIFKLVKNGVEEFTRIFFHDNYVSPYLIWNKEMRDELFYILEKRLEKYQTGLLEGITKSQRNNIPAQSSMSHNQVDPARPKDIYDIFPKLKIKTHLVQYKNTKLLLKAGPVYLSPFISYHFRNEVIDQEYVPQMLEDLGNLYKLKAENLKNIGPQTDINQIYLYIRDIYMILASYKRILKIYGGFIPKKDMIGQNFVDFSHKILEFWSEYDNFDQLRINIKSSHKNFSKLKFFYDQNNGATLPGNEAQSDIMLRAKTYYIWEHSICKLFEILSEVMDIQNTQEQYRSSKTTKIIDILLKHDELKQKICLVATKILLPVLTKNPFISYNRLKILESLVKIIRILQDNDHVIFDVFRVSEQSMERSFNIKEVFFSIFEIYKIWYSNLQAFHFKGLFVPYRNNSHVSDEIDYLSYGIMAVVTDGQSKTEDSNSVQAVFTAEKPEKTSFFKKEKYERIFDIVSTNCINLCISKENQVLDVHSIRYESKMISLISDVLGIINEISAVSNPKCELHRLFNPVSIIHRVAELAFLHPMDSQIFADQIHPSRKNSDISTGKPKDATPEKDDQSETPSNANKVEQQKKIHDRNVDYHLINKLRALHLKSRKVLGEAISSMLQASLIHGITNYENMLKPVNSIYIEGLRERGVARSFNKPRNIEYQLNNLIDDLGEPFIVESILIQEGNFKYTDSVMEKYEETSQSNLKKAVDRDKATILQGFYTQQQTQSKRNMIIPDVEKILPSELEANQKINAEKELNIEIDGIYLSSYIKNPIPVKNPILFVEELTDLMASVRNQIPLLKGLLLCLKENPQLELKQNPIVKLVELYTKSNSSVEEGDTQAQVRDRICDIFNCQASMYLTNKKPMNWLFIKEFRVMIMDVFLDINVDISNNQHQVLIKWCIILDKLLKTKTEKVFDDLLMVCFFRVSLDKSLSQNLRKRFMEVLYEFDFLNIPEIRKFVSDLISALKIQKQPDEIDFRELIDLLSVEVINPKLVWTDFTSKKMVENLSQIILRAKIKDLDNLALRKVAEIKPLVGLSSEAKEEPTEEPKKLPVGLIEEVAGQEEENEAVEGSQQPQIEQPLPDDLELRQVNSDISEELEDELVLEEDDKGLSQDAISQNESQKQSTTLKIQLNTSSELDAEFSFDVLDPSKDKFILPLNLLLEKEVVFEDVGLKILILNQRKRSLMEDYFFLLQPLLDEITNLTSSSASYYYQWVPYSEFDDKQEQKVMEVLKARDRLDVLITSAIILSEFYNQWRAESILSNDFGATEPGEHETVVINTQEKKIFNSKIVLILKQVYRNFFVNNLNFESSYIEYKEFTKLLKVLALELCYINYEESMDIESVIKELVSSTLQNPRNSTLVRKRKQELSLKSKKEPKVEQNLAVEAPVRTSMSNILLQDYRASISDIIVIGLLNLFFLKNMKLAKIIDVQSLVDIVEKIIQVDADSAVAYAYFNIFATLIQFETMGLQVDLEIMKKKLGSIFMGILSIQVGEIKEGYWSSNLEGRKLGQRNFFNLYDGSVFPVVRKTMPIINSSCTNIDF